MAAGDAVLLGNRTTPPGPQDPGVFSYVPLHVTG
jgi:hypothetical protein